MSEPKPIAITSPVAFAGTFYKVESGVPSSEKQTVVYDDGTMRRVNGHPFHITEFHDQILPSISIATKHIFNEGPIHPDDWYWNEAEQRMKEMSALSEEEQFEAALAGIRITVHEWKPDRH